MARESASAAGENPNFSCMAVGSPTRFPPDCAGSSAVERLVYTQLVGGSIPSPRTNISHEISVSLPPACWAPLGG